MRSIVVSLIAISFLVTVLKPEEPQVRQPSYNPFTDEEEIRFGNALAEAVEKQSHVVRNPLLSAYLDDIVRKLGKASQRPSMPYRCTVLDSAVINAYSLPGPHVFVTTGFLRALEDESELAGALGHEIGHIAGRHSMNDLAIMLASKKVVEQARQRFKVLNDEQIQKAIVAVGGPLVILAQRKMNREQEHEADLLGFYAMRRAGWSPVGMVRYFERLRMFTAKPNLIDGLFSTHPEPGDRFDRLRRELKVVTLTPDLRDNTFSFKVMKQGLSLMPPPADAQESGGK